MKTDNTFNSNKATKLVNIKNGTASVTVTADKNMQNIQNFTATYNGNSKYYENISAIVKAQIKSRKAKVVVTTTPTTQDQRKAITFKVKITDITKTKATIPKNNNNSYVYFKINGNTLQDSSSKTVKVKVVNGTATYKYTIPPATAGLTSSKKTKNYVLTAIYCNPNYSTAKNTTTYHVKRSTTRFNITKTTYAKKTGTLTITGKLKDYKNCNVLGTTYVNLKINGQVFKINNKIAEYKVQNGTVNIKIKVPTSIKTIQNVTLTSKDRLAYIYTTATTKKITRV
ncbi:MAG: hypothetical protein BZ138_04535 [Methanosphaera sp. rholeuAM270]|nr:MAG: hypothetical protein BZ138_04535 [Methanosphaera sp. rholeuAM270]